MLKPQFVRWSSLKLIASLVLSVSLVFCGVPLPAFALRAEQSPTVRAGLEKGLIRHPMSGLEEAPVIEPKVLETFNGGFSATGRRWPLYRPHTFSWVTNGLLAVHHGKQIRLLQVWKDGQHILTSQFASIRDFDDPDAQLVAIPGMDIGIFHLIVWSGKRLYQHSMDLAMPTGQPPTVHSFESIKETVDMSDLGGPRGAVFDPVSAHVLFLGMRLGEGVQARGLHHVRWTKLSEGRIAELRHLEDPIQLVVDPSRDWIWAVNHKAYSNQLMAFRWNSKRFRYDRMGSIPLPEFWGFQARLVVEPVSGEILVTSPYYQQILVLKPNVRGSELAGVDFQKIIRLPAVYEETDQSPPIPITIDPETRHILVGDPFGRQIWVLAPLAEQANPELTLFDLIDREKLPRPVNTLFWNPIGFQFGSNNRPIVWDKGQKRFFAGRIKLDPLRSAEEIPLREVDWTTPLTSDERRERFDRFSVRQEFNGQWIRWDVEAGKKEFFTGTELRLNVSYGIGDREVASKEFRNELIIPQEVRNLENLERDRRGISKDSEVWLTSRLEPDGSLRLYLLVQDLSGWRPFAWEGRVVFRDGQISLPAGEIFWHGIDDRYLLGVGMDSLGRPWAIRWKPYLSDGKKGILPAMVPLPSKFPLSKVEESAGLEEIRRTAERWVEEGVGASSVAVDQPLKARAVETILALANPSVLPHLMEDSSQADSLWPGQSWQAVHWHSGTPLARIDYNLSGSLNLTLPSGQGVLVSTGKAARPLSLKKDFLAASLSGTSQTDSVPLTEFLSGYGIPPGALTTEAFSLVVEEPQTGMSVRHAPLTFEADIDPWEGEISGMGITVVSLRPFFQNLPEGTIVKMASRVHGTDTLLSQGDLKAYFETGWMFPMLLVDPSFWVGRLFIPPGRATIEEAFLDLITMEGNHVEGKGPSFGQMDDENRLRWLQRFFLVVPVNLGVLAQAQGIPLSQGGLEEEDEGILEGVLKDQGSLRMLNLKGEVLLKDPDGKAIIVIQLPAQLPSISRGYFQQGLQVPAGLQSLGTEVVRLGAGLEEVLQVWQEQPPGSGDVILFNVEHTPKGPQLSAWLPLVTPLPTVLRGRPETVARMTVEVLAVVAQMARRLGYALDLETTRVTFLQVGPMTYAIVRSA